ncbi:unnamed protein product [Haemonchus placei]|uniref:Uncharacterized protein n=1 Tax=Haemonchus placei TaxID=6290 RepID=A0A0N4WZR4_HAEPC|nr:unnamed protein product [Haemonchus placei]
MPPVSCVSSRSTDPGPPYSATAGELTLISPFCPSDTDTSRSTIS